MAKNPMVYVRVNSHAGGTIRGIVHMVTTANSNTNVHTATDKVIQLKTVGAIMTNKGN